MILGKQRSQFILKHCTVVISMFCLFKLGDLWSYDYYNEKFVVSPEPDVSVHELDAGKHKCLIFASDGLWNMVSPEESVTLVMNLEKHFEERIINDSVRFFELSLYKFSPDTYLVCHSL